MDASAVDDGTNESVSEVVDVIVGEFGNSEKVGVPSSEFCGVSGNCKDVVSGRTVGRIEVDGNVGVRVGVLGMSLVEGDGKSLSAGERVEGIDGNSEKVGEGGSKLGQQNVASICINIVYKRGR